MPVEITAGGIALILNWRITSWSLGVLFALVLRRIVRA
jgi:hypothetical protein